MLSLCGGAGNGAGGVHPCTALLGAPSLSLEPEPGVEAAVPRSENVLLPLPLLPLLLVPRPLRLPNDGLNFDRSVCVKPYFAMPMCVCVCARARVCVRTWTYEKKSRWNNGR